MLRGLRHRHVRHNLIVGRSTSEGHQRGEEEPFCRSHTPSRLVAVSRCHNQILSSSALPVMFLELLGHRRSHLLRDLMVSNFPPGAQHPLWYRKLLPNLVNMMTPPFYFQFSFFGQWNSPVFFLRVDILPSHPRLDAFYRRTLQFSKRRLPCNHSAGRAYVRHGLRFRVCQAHPSLHIPRHFRVPFSPKVLEELIQDLLPLGSTRSSLE